jgi:hypothetical protein
MIGNTACNQHIQYPGAERAHSERERNRPFTSPPTHTGIYTRVLVPAPQWRREAPLRVHSARGGVPGAAANLRLSALTSRGWLAHMTLEQLQERQSVHGIGISHHVPKLTLEMPRQARGGPETSHLPPPLGRNFRIEFPEEPEAAVNLGPCDDKIALKWREFALQRPRSCYEEPCCVVGPLHLPATRLQDSFNERGKSA